MNNDKNPADVGLKTTLRIKKHPEMTGFAASFSSSDPRFTLLPPRSEHYPDASRLGRRAQLPLQEDRGCSGGTKDGCFGPLFWVWSPRRTASDGTSFSHSARAQETRFWNRRTTGRSGWISARRCSSMTAPLTAYL